MRLRIIKLSKSYFETKEDVISVFIDPERDDGLSYEGQENGYFILNEEIALNTLSANDNLIFTYLGKVIYYAKCSEGIQKYDEDSRYFLIETKSIVRISDIPLMDIQLALKDIQYNKCIYRQGWNRIEDELAIKTILDFIGIGNK